MKINILDAWLSDTCLQKYSNGCENKGSVTPYQIYFWLKKYIYKMIIKTKYELYTNLYRDVPYATILCKRFYV